MIQEQARLFEAVVVDRDADRATEGFADIAEWFDTLAKAKKNHAARFTQGLKSIRL